MASKSIPQRSTEELLSLKKTLTAIVFTVLGIDLIIVAAFVYLLISGRSSSVLPAIGGSVVVVAAVMPALVQLQQVRAELAKRAAS